MAAVEIFANDATTTVASGGTTAPSGGTQETWTVASSASFPAASSSAVPATQFHVADPALEAEKIAVVNVSGTTWTVIRGAEGTTPVAHSAGFAVYQVVTSGVLAGFQQSFPQAAGQTPAYPAVMEPAKWAMVSLDTGPDALAAAYDNKTILFNTGTTGNTGGAASSLAVTVPAGVKTGDLLLLVVEINTSSSKTPQVVATSGHTWTLLGSVLHGVNGSNFNDQAVFTRTATSGDAGDTLTLAASGGGSVFIAAALGAWTNAASVGATATFTGSSNIASITAPAITTTAAGGVVVFAGTGNVGGGGTGILSGSAASPYAFQREATSTGGNMAVLGDSAQWWAAGTSQGGAGVTFGGVTATLFCAMTIELVPAAGYDGSVLPVLTANANGVLAVDGGSPQAGDRVAVIQNFGNAVPSNQGYPTGIYTVTSAGSAGSKWVMTRAADLASSAALGQYWAVQILYGTSYGSGGQARVVCLFPGMPVIASQASQSGTLPAGGLPYIMGYSSHGMAAQAAYSNAYGQSTVAIGSASAAYGSQGSATASNAIALGNSSVANGGVAIGSYSNVVSGDGVTIGRYTYASQPGGIAVGAYTSAYTPDLTAIASGQIGTTGDSQFAAVVFAGQTANATPKAITPQDGAFAFADRSGVTSWKRTTLVRLFAVARRTDTPGTDSAWSAQGVVRGNGSSSYSWVGGSAPSFTVISQDAGASAWAVAATISSNTLVVTVTGASGATINWSVTAELYEAVG